MSAVVLPTSSAARSVPARLRLTPRGRTVFTTLAAVPLVIAACVFALNGGGANASLDNGGEFEFITVSAGQSLWQLAEDVAPGSDPRDVIAAIMQVNQLASPDISAGQELALPPQFAR